MAEQLRVTATEANRSFSTLLRKVRQGSSIDITAHGQVVAELRPKTTLDPAEQERRQAIWESLKSRIVAQPRHIIGPWTRGELYERD